MKKMMILLMVAMATIAGARAADGIDKEIVAGMNVSSFNGTAFSSRIGFHAGLRVNVGLPRVSQGLYVNGAALFSLRGASADSTTFNPFYLDIPVHLGYKYAFSDDVAVFGESGPYVGIGLFGTTDGKSVFGDANGLKRFEVGLGVRAGVEMKRKLVVSMGYDGGLTDIIKDSDVSTKDHNFYISLGYKF